ncbi:hypothetical protein BJ508DRAFT_311020 [Ascobolus immersus RN42]|uniref:Uncharacterized protein n=1 Tax=Ascobolus immersus RN42 TaxID=1160509 RepID=A0A3N4HRN8_ASCIM|nr:hypothetical protein BJ508DRAFT_311020 [Ascobolus immersus RN42]
MAGFSYLPTEMRLEIPYHILEWGDFNCYQQLDRINYTALTEVGKLGRFTIDSPADLFYYSSLVAPYNESTEAQFFHDIPSDAGIRVFVQGNGSRHRISENIRAQHFWHQLWQRNFQSVLDKLFRPGTFQAPPNHLVATRRMNSTKDAINAFCGTWTEALVRRFTGSDYGETAR